jgi:hypothetical protein
MASGNHPPSSIVDHEKYLHTPATICLSLDDDSSMGAHAVSGTSVPPSTIIVAADYSLEPQLSTSSDHTYPEGGWRANITVAGAFLALFFSFGQMNAFGTFQAWYAAHQLQRLPAATISWIGSLQLWMFFFSVSTDP